MPKPSPHEWLRPRLVDLLAEAEAAGIERDISVAVITDLVNGVLSAPVPMPAEDNPNKDIGEPDSMASEPSGVHPSTPDLPVDSLDLGRSLPNVGRSRRY